jgi:nucleotide-binding universal stress UspA family protein
MPAFTRAVVGLDGSETAIHALRWTIERVSDPEQVHAVHAGTADPELPADVTIGAMHTRDTFAVEALIETALEVDADVIVVGPHGSGIGRGLGSVAKQLLREAPLPVVLIDELEPPRKLGLRPPVVACVGYGDPASTASNWAADYAEAMDLPLVLLHSVAYRPVFPIDSPADMLASYLGSDVSVQWATEELESMARELRSARPDLEISTHVESTSLVRSVREAGETAEIVVLGKRSDEEFLHTIGTPRLRRLVARAHFPTAVVPAATASE